jgi:hypothetical protein
MPDNALVQVRGQPGMLSNPPLFSPLSTVSCFPLAITLMVCLIMIVFVFPKIPYDPILSLLLAQR